MQPALHSVHATGWCGSSFHTTPGVNPEPLPPPAPPSSRANLRSDHRESLLCPTPSLSPDVARSVLQHRNMSAAPVPTQAEAEEKIINLLMTFEPLEALGREKVTVDAHFINDLGLDSLDIVECVM